MTFRGWLRKDARRPQPRVGSARGCLLVSIRKQGNDYTKDDRYRKGGDRRCSKVICLGVVTAGVGNGGEHDLDGRGKRNTKQIAEHSLSAFVSSRPELRSSGELDELAHPPEGGISPKFPSEASPAQPLYVSDRGPVAFLPLGELSSKVEGGGLGIGHAILTPLLVEELSAIHRCTC